MRAIHLLPLLLLLRISDCDAEPWGNDIYARLDLLCTEKWRNEFFHIFFGAIIGLAEEINENTFKQSQLVHHCPYNQWETLGTHLQSLRSAPPGSLVTMHLESLRVVNYNLIARLRFEGFHPTRRMVYDYEIYVPQGHGTYLVTFFRNLRVLKIWTVC